MENHEKHLRLLSIFHYVVGGGAALFALFPIFHFFMGLFMLSMSLFAPTEAAEPVIFLAMMGGFFTVSAGAMILFGLAFAVAIAVSGYFIGRREHHTYCLVMAGIECMFMPFGTVLGVVTLITLLQPKVEALFNQAEPG